jgi:hypothetical protein
MLSEYAIRGGRNVRIKSADLRNSAGLEGVEASSKYGKYEKAWCHVPAGSLP